MKIKKINAILGLMTILALAGHMGTMCVSLYTGWYNFMLCKSLAGTAFLCLVLHVISSLVIMFFFHDGAAAGLYPKENLRLIIQRTSALMIIAVIHIHTTAYSHMATGEVLTTGKTLFFWVFELIYISCVVIHIASSLSKAFITLGTVTSQQTIRNIDRTAYIACAIAGLIAIGGVTTFFIGGLL